MKNINQGYVLEKNRIRAASSWISQKAFQSKGILQILRAELRRANRASDHGGTEGMEGQQGKSSQVVQHGGILCVTG